MQHLLIVDPQNDFCDIPGAALPVPGAAADLQRLARFVAARAPDAITVTLDSHPSVAVERTSFWCTPGGEAPPAFTFVTAQDLSAGRLRPRDATLAPQVGAMLEQLARAGRPGQVIWPVHCVTGTWGHNLYAPLAEALAGWEYSRQRAVRKVLKGEYPLSEHFGVFEADAPDPAVPSTQFNTALATALTQGVQRLFVAGQAASHCVAASVDQLLAWRERTPGPMPQIVLLRDCMSPVPGFEPLQDEFFARARARGLAILSHAEALALH